MMKAKGPNSPFVVSENHHRKSGDSRIILLSDRLDTVY